MAEFFLPQRMREGLRILQKIQKESNLDIESKRFLAEQRHEISHLYQAQLFVRLYLISVLIFILGIFFADPQDLHILALKTLICTTAVLAIRFEWTSYRATSGMILLFLLIVNVDEAFADCHSLSPFLCYLLRTDLMLPLLVIYFAGRKASFVMALICSGILLIAFAASSRPDFTLIRFWLEHGQALLTFGTLQGVVPLFIFLIFDHESQIHQVILTKLLSESEFKSDTKSKFIMRMSHDLRTPLHGLLSSTTLLQQTNLTDEQSSYLAPINACGDLMLDIIGNILDISKIESGKYENEPQRFSFFDLVQQIAEALAILADEKGIELLLEFDPLERCFDVEGDQKKLKEILINLAGNALKFTDQGHVLISVTSRRLPATPTEDSAIFRIEVEDTGVGISNELLPSVFDPFTQRGSAQKRAEGTGLGLAISKTLTEALGGTIGVNFLDKGSKFWIEFPLRVLPLGTIYPSLQSLPISLEEISKMCVGIYSHGRSLGILEKYLSLWKVPHVVLGNHFVPGQQQNLGKEITHLIIDQCAWDSVLSATASSSKELFPRVPSLVLCTLSSLAAVRRKFEELNLASLTLLGIKPFSPIKFSQWLVQILSRRPPSTSPPSSSPANEEVS